MSTKTYNPRTRLATSGARRDSAVVLKGVEVAVSYR